MNPALRTFAALVSTLASVAATACTIGETRDETVRVPVQKATSSITCTGPVTKPDLSTLKPCGEGKGKGHCYKKNRLPLPPDQFTGCDGDETCVPDSILLAGGKRLKTCTFFMDKKPGACASVLMTMVDQFKDQLTQDICDPDERCAPCVSPLDGTSTHMCDEDMGVHESDCTGGSGEKVATCCHAMGVCMTEEGVPPANRDQMQRETCPEHHLCAPAGLATGKPTTCEVLGLSGVCMDLCFAAMFQATTPVTRSSCGPTEMCLPCALAKTQGPTPGCN
jgi:hypothetical protein